MYYTYVLLCLNKNFNEFYYGFTSDLRQRLKAHIDKQVDTTKKFDKIKLVYTGFGRGYIKRRLKDYLKSRD